MTRLIENWRDVIRRAWSIRLIVLAGFLSAAEVAIPFFNGALPQGVFAGLSAVATGAAFVARLVAQRDLLGNADNATPYKN